MIILNIWKNKTCSKPPTRYIFHTYWDSLYTTRWKNLGDDLVQGPGLYDFQPGASAMIPWYASHILLTVAPNTHFDPTNIFNYTMFVGLYVIPNSVATLSSLFLAGEPTCKKGTQLLATKCIWPDWTWETENWLSFPSHCGLTNYSAEISTSLSLCIYIYIYTHIPYVPNH